MRLPLLIILLICWANLFGQQFYLRGQIKDEAGKELQGARIELRSNGQVYLTGLQGLFGIALPKQADTLRLNFVGYQEKLIPVNSKDYQNITMLIDHEQMKKAKRKLVSRTTNWKIKYDDLVYKGNETYSSIFENRLISAQKFPSTEIALHYNRASYSNIRRFLNMNTSVPPDAVRIEEMLNYFDWNYKEPPGNDVFKINSRIAPCPWNKQAELLFMNVYSRKLNLENLPPSHLVFLLDISGSMDLPNRLPLLKSGFRFLVNNLRSKDTISLVAYGGKTSVLLDAVSGSEKTKILNTIDSLSASGSTPGESGIKTAYRLARLHYIKGGNNRIILATDGDFNVGVRSEDELEQLIIRQKQGGIYLTCIGVGMGDYKDSKIQTLAHKGNGNFAYLDSYAEAEKVLFKEFFQTVYTVADDVSLKIKFDTTLVEQYRLIGYDNKIAAMRDTTALVQGAEVGSGTSLLVAFEVIPKKTAAFSSNTSFAKVNIAYQSISNQQPAEFSYQIPYERKSFEELEDDYRFATAVIMTGMKIKQSVYAKNIKWNEIAAIAKAAVLKPNFIRQEFLQLIDIAKAGPKKRKKFLFFYIGGK